jgi:hypothetical protein
VEIALDPAPLCVRRLDDPAPGRVDLLELGPKVVLEPLVRHREAGDGAHRTHEHGVVEQALVVDDGAGHHPVGLEDRRCPPATGGWQCRRPAAFVDPAAIAGRDEDAQRRIAQGVLQGTCEILAPWRPARRGQHGHGRR